MKQKKWRLLDLIMFSVFFIGVLSLAYPFVSDTLNNYLDQQIIKNYQKKAKSEHATELAELQKRMIKKNEQLASNVAMPEADPFSKKKKMIKNLRNRISNHIPLVF
ncbi:sortase A [Enterococcus sp. AZ084]